MKCKYTSPEIEIIEFTTEDVITSSSDRFIPGSFPAGEDEGDLPIKLKQ